LPGKGIYIDSPSKIGTVLPGFVHIEYRALIDGGLNHWEAPKKGSAGFICTPYLFDPEKWNHFIADAQSIPGTPKFDGRLTYYALVISSPYPSFWDFDILAHISSVGD
jgi:hypothetical protein